MSATDTAEPSFREFGIQTITERLNKMLSYTEQVRLAEDIEALHDMRVASRRLRAAISVFEAAIPDREFAAFEREVKGVTDALGEARDLDVIVETLEGLELTVPKGQRAGLEAFANEKRAARIASQRGVIKAFDRLDRKELSGWFVEIATHASRPVDEATPKMPGKAPKSGKSRKSAKTIKAENEASNG